MPNRYQTGGSYGRVPVPQIDPMGSIYGMLELAGAAERFEGSRDQRKQAAIKAAEEQTLNRIMSGPGSLEEKAAALDRDGLWRDADRVRRQGVQDKDAEAAREVTELRQTLERAQLGYGTIAVEQNEALELFQRARHDPSIYGSVRDRLAELGERVGYSPPETWNAEEADRLIPLLQTEAQRVQALQNTLAIGAQEAADARTKVEADRIALGLFSQFDIQSQEEYDDYIGVVKPILSENAWRVIPTFDGRFHERQEKLRRSVGGKQPPSAGSFDSFTNMNDAERQQFGQDYQAYNEATKPPAQPRTPPFGGLEHWAGATPEEQQRIGAAAQAHSRATSPPASTPERRAAITARLNQRLAAIDRESRSLDSGFEDEGAIAAAKAQARRAAAEELAILEGRSTPSAGARAGRRGQARAQYESRTGRQSSPPPSGPSPEAVRMRPPGGPADGSQDEMVPLSEVEFMRASGATIVR